VEIMRLLLDALAANTKKSMHHHLSSTASLGRNPVVVAAVNGNSECLKLLLEEYGRCAVSAHSCC
jgi:hypothetical protein